MRARLTCPQARAAGGAPGQGAPLKPVKAWQPLQRAPQRRASAKGEVDVALEVDAPSSRPWEAQPSTSGRPPRPAEGSSDEAEAAPGSSSRAAASTLSSRARQLAERRPAQVCGQCGGRGIVAGVTGPVPCPECQSWRRRPDYQPGSSLLSVRDLNLGALESDTSSSAKWAARRPADSAGATTSSSSKEGKPASRQRRPMPESQREAIKAALQNRGPFSQDHKRSISRAMRDAHAKNPLLSGSGRPKRCSHCGEEGHNKKTCPQLHPERAQQAAEAAEAARVPTQRVCSICKQPGHYKNACPEAAKHAAAVLAAAPRKLIIIEEEPGQLPVLASAWTPPPAAGAAPAPAAAAEAAPAAPAAAAAQAATARDGGSTPAAREQPPGEAATSSGSAGGSGSLGATRLPSGDAGAGRAPSSSGRGAASVAPFSMLGDYGSGVSVPRDLVPTVRVGPGMSLSPEGSWVFPLPARREECVQQAVSAVLRAWDDGIRRQGLELLLPQANADAGGGWPGGIRQQFRAAQPLVEALLRQVKTLPGLEGRVTPEWLDETDCVAAWQSERLAAVLFPTADSMPALQRIDDALSGERLTLVINPQWQTQGQVISDFGFGRSRKQAERFVNSFDDVYYLRRVRLFGDDIRVLRCYPGQWQVHYVTPGRKVLLLGCEDTKPTYERLIELLKAVEGSRISKSWLDRALTAGYDPAAPSYEDEDQGEAPLEVAAAEAGAAPQEAAAAAAVPQPARDIVTGEVLLNQDGGEAARDYRLDAVKEIAKWLS